MSELRSLSNSGVVAKGTTQLIGVGVISLSGDTAQLVGCVMRGEIDIYSSTGRPVPGPAGRAGPDVIRAEMTETSLGWKVKSETTEEAQCPFT